MRCEHCGKTSYDAGGVPICCHCGKKQTVPIAEPFPADVAAVIDKAWTERESAHELDSEGRFVRGVWQGMTVDEVMADREAFRRCTE